jgi:uncharacterized damage-inducible protein DinB
MSAQYPPQRGNELETLTTFLDYYRAVVIDKASGLPAADLNRRLGPSTLTLGNVVHHLALVEHWWFHECFAGGEVAEPWVDVPWDDDPDWDFTIAATLDPETIFERYERQCARSRQVVQQAESLEQPSARTNRKGDAWSLRWILVHMIEETARHAGHMDLIRESIDGETGDFRSED